MNEVEKYSGNRATVLIGPYGKGKSHLLLVLLAILSKQNYSELTDLRRRILLVAEGNEALINNAFSDTAPMLPVIVNPTNMTLGHALSKALSDALRRNGLTDIVPDNIYTEALKAIENWKVDYPGTYKLFLEKCIDIPAEEIISGLRRYDYTSLSQFQAIYPSLTSGAHFNPDVDDEIISVYSSVNRLLSVKYGYKGIYIVFDEFSKYIEGHSENGFASDMKTLQDICELANSSHDEQLHITCVAHKSIKSYGPSLPKSVLNAFEGVEGRLKEVYFTVSSKNNYELVADAIQKTELFDQWARDDEQYQTISRSSRELNNFRSLFTENDFNTIVAKGCFPLAPVATMLLLELSEKIAQNERTIFTFVTSKERNGLERIINRADGTEFIGADRIYDYFQPLFEEEYETEVHHEWLKADYALGKEQLPDAQKIIKTIAVINMLNKPDEYPAKRDYLRLALGLQEKQFSDALDKLLTTNIIEVDKRTGAFKFKNNIGVDVEAEIAECIKKRFLKPDFCEALDQISRYKYIAPKKHNQTYCITRFFNYKFMTAQQFAKLKDRHYLKYDNAPDGVVIMLLPWAYDEQEVFQHLEEMQDPCVLLMLPLTDISIYDKVREYLAVNYLRTDETFIENNQVIAKELDNLRADLLDEINDTIRDIYFRTHRVYTESGALDIGTYGLNRVISDICDKVYNLTPVINHELINRNNLSSAIMKARSNLLTDMLKSQSLPDKYLDATSSEATIYRATLYQAARNATDNPGLREVNREIDLFIEGSINKRQKFSLLLEKLMSPPYGMRKGPVALFLADHLLKLSDIPIIYLNSKEIGLDAETFSNVIRKPDEYSLYIEKESIEKKVYIDSLASLFSSYNLYCNEIDRRNMLTKVVCMIQSWYRSLPQTSILYTEPDSLEDNISEVIAFRKLFSDYYLNPREILFDKIPRIMGTNDFHAIVENIGDIKKQIESHVFLLKERVVAVIREEFGFNPESNLAKSLNDWYEKLSDTVKNSVLSSKASYLRSFASTVRTNDIYEIAGKIGKEITGSYIEDWKSGMERDSFRQELRTALAEINSKTESTLVEIEVPKGTSTQAKYYTPIGDNLSVSGHFFKNALDDLISEYGSTISNEEKVGILMELVQEMMQ